MTQVHVEHPKAALIISALVEFFVAQGGKNYVAVTAMHPETEEEFEVVIQRKGGTTPSERVTELQEQVALLKQQNATLSERLRKQTAS